MIYIDTPISIPTARDLNVTHGNMGLHLDQAYPQSEALREVAENQYVNVLAELQRSIDRVLALQQKTIELATGNAPNAEVESLKNLMGL